MVLVLTMPSIVQATEIVATSEAEVSTDKMAEETSEKAEVSSEKLPVEDENQHNKEHLPTEFLESEIPELEENHLYENEILENKTGNDYVKGESDDFESGIEPRIIDDLIFRFEGTDGNSSASVIGYLGPGGHVEIPSKVTNQLAGWVNPSPVTLILSHAFQGESLTSVTIPDTVVGIGTYAFSDNRLTSLIIPNSVTAIDPYAFIRNRLNSIQISENLQSLSVGVFASNHLSDITIPSSVQFISQAAFDGNLLTSLVLPEKIGYIGERAFSRNLISHVKFLGMGGTIQRWIFEGNPVRYIETKLEYLETVRNSLEAHLVMSGVSEQTILRSLAYIEGTQSNLTVGYGEDVSYEISQQYRLQTNLWEPYTPEVQWFKDEAELSSQTEPILHLELEELLNI